MKEKLSRLHLAWTFLEVLDEIYFNYFVQVIFLSKQFFHQTFL